MTPATGRSERGAGLALVPILATALFYAAPTAWQGLRPVQFLPQVCAYGALAIWSRLNASPLSRLGLAAPHGVAAVQLGVGVGLTLGALNLAVILLAVPALGYDYTFLTQTPHAAIPLWLMMPWFIGFIAGMVELNFRGFVLGRLQALGLSPALAVVGSALLFAFDPFMVATFRHLHWIAVWDGVIWGTLRIRLGNLAAPIVAHAVEVIVLYSVMRAVLS